MKKTLFLSLMIGLLSCELTDKVIKPKPTYDFSYTVGNNGVVNFTSSATETERVEWDIEGMRYTDFNPVHRFSRNGNYTVVATAYNGKRSVKVSKGVQITTVPGTFVLWSKNIPNQAEVYINGSYNGRITHTHGSQPDCDNGNVFRTYLREGTYNYTVVIPNKATWTGVAEIRSGVCYRQELLY